MAQTRQREERETSLLHGDRPAGHDITRQALRRVGGTSVCALAGALSNARSSLFKTESITFSFKRDQGPRPAPRPLSDITRRSTTPIYLGFEKTRTRPASFHRAAKPASGPMSMSAMHTTIVAGPTYQIRQTSQRPPRRSSTSSTSSLDPTCYTPWLIWLIPTFLLA